MTLAPSICAVCQKQFQRQRHAQRTCSKACKQSLFRAEKCNAQHEDSQNSEKRADGSGTTDFLRVWPGLKPLSDLECRVMRVTPTGHRDKRGALLYQSTMNENGPASAATDPDHGSLERSSK